MGFGLRVQGLEFSAAGFMVSGFGFAAFSGKVEGSTPNFGFRFSGFSGSRLTAVSGKGEGRTPRPTQSNSHRPAVGWCSVISPALGIGSGFWARGSRCLAGRAHGNVPGGDVRG